jgi:hypothetical protein
MRFNVKIFPVLGILTCLFILQNCSLNKVHSFFNSDQKENISDTEFVENSDDVPLFAALKKFGEEDVDFDSASGSISSLIYESEVDFDQVKNFYIKTMPQMGWKISQNSKRKIIFYRQKQKLEIELIVQKGRNLVKFFILE